jgi:hypothetical protein
MFAELHTHADPNAGIPAPISWSQPCTTTSLTRILPVVINPLNAELNPICYLLVLLGDLKFMGPCIVSIFQYTSNKMQRYTIYL